MCLALLLLRISSPFVPIVLDKQKYPFFSSVISAINYILHSSQVPHLKIYIFTIIFQTIGKKR